MKDRVHPSASVLELSKLRQFTCKVAMITVFVLNLEASDKLHKLLYNLDRH